MNGDTSSPNAFYRQICEKIKCAAVLRDEFKIIDEITYGDGTMVKPDYLHYVLLKSTMKFATEFGKHFCESKTLFENLERHNFRWMCWDRMKKMVKRVDEVLSIPVENWIYEKTNEFLSNAFPSSNSLSKRLFKGDFCNHNLKIIIDIDAENEVFVVDIKGRKQYELVKKLVDKLNEKKIDSNDLQWQDIEKRIMDAVEPEKVDNKWIDEMIEELNKGDCSMFQNQQSLLDDLNFLADPQ